MLQGVKAIIFDLDGTLVDSMWIWKLIDIEYLGMFGVEVPEDLQEDIEGMSFSQTAHYFKERFRIPHTIEEMKDEWNKRAYEKYQSEIPLKKGVKPFLDYCITRDIKLGIASSNSIELVRVSLEAHGIIDYFQAIHTSCEVSTGKPAPYIYELVANTLQVQPSECLVFEDIVAGIMAGQSAGMKVCAIEDAYSVYQREEKVALADYYITDYTEIPMLCHNESLVGLDN
ncbi:MAG: HAD family phosphatase [Eubacteriales bacterium]